MLHKHLHTAGFFSIRWAPTESAPKSGTTYVRPSARGVLRVFVSAGDEEVELYAGRLAHGELRYRGPVPSEDQLQQLLAGAYSASTIVL
jgi:hypothetical protein